MDTSGEQRMNVAAGAGLTGRYAQALFALAKDAGQIESVGGDLDRVDAALAQSPDFAALTTSPLVGRDAAGKAVAAVAGELGLAPTTRNFLLLLAREGRLAILPGAIAQYRAAAAAARGETTASVVSARPLSDDQRAALAAKLSARAGRQVSLDTRVDPALLGGFTARIGSQLIDASLKTRLDRAALAMRG